MWFEPFHICSTWCFECTRIVSWDVLFSILGGFGERFILLVGSLCAAQQVAVGPNGMNTGCLWFYYSAEQGHPPGPCLPLWCGLPSDHSLQSCSDVSGMARNVVELRVATCEKDFFVALVWPTVFCLHCPFSSQSITLVYSHAIIKWQWQFHIVHTYKIPVWIRSLKSYWKLVEGAWVLTISFNLMYK